MQKILVRVARVLALVLVSAVGLASGTACGRENQSDAGLETVSTEKQLSVQAVKRVFESADIPLSEAADNNASAFLLAPAEESEIIYVVVWRKVSHRAPVDTQTPATRREIGNVDVYVPETLTAERAKALHQAIRDLEKMLRE